MDAITPQQRYLIFSHVTVHAVVHIVEAPNLTDALWHYIWMVHNPDIVRRPDGSLEDDGLVYEHPLEFIEANEKRYGEWQMRLLLEPTPEEPVTEAFCGDDEDNVEYVVAECRRKFGTKRTKAFVWYVREGTLVTFYRKSKPYRIKVLKRYLCNYEGGPRNIRVWKGDYTDLMDALYLLPY
ncbi:MAG: hypothetical protein JWL77_1820 [Chthonomonadaceae bacterium]|nr:hypothetical protein [Chthonomonadaceae bacterium]